MASRSDPFVKRGLSAVFHTYIHIEEGERSRQCSQNTQVDAVPTTPTLTIRYGRARESLVTRGPLREAS